MGTYDAQVNVDVRPVITIWYLVLPDLTSVDPVLHSIVAALW